MTAYTIIHTARPGRALHRGLSLGEAFFQLLAEADQDHVLERRARGHALILWPRTCKPFTPRVLTSWCEHPGDARMALMRAAIREAFQPFLAVDDEGFEALHSATRGGATDHGGRAFGA